MNTPLIHPATEVAVQAIIRDIPQSLLLIGPPGIGLLTIATYIAQQVGASYHVTLPEKDDKIDLEKGVISVDMIRRLYDQTRSKHTDKQIIIIDYAERMAISAQNAFLKLLEEPKSTTYFILLSHTPNSLLPTITSRTQRSEIRPIERHQSHQLLDSLHVSSEQKRTQLLFMGDGLPAELHRLVNDENYFKSRSQIVRDARQLLRGSPYERLKVAQDYKDDRQKALLLLRDALHIIRQSVVDKPQLNVVRSIEKLLDAYERIEANGNIRLCLARLVI